MRQKFCLLLSFLFAMTLLCGCGDLISVTQPDRTPSTEHPPEPTGQETAPMATEDANPVPVSNPYREFYDRQTGYLLPESDTRYFFRTELTNTDLQWLRVARNEIYARHGYVFKDQNLAEYFSSMPWYEPIAGQDPSGSFNKYEQHNVMLLGMIQDLLEGKSVSLKGKNPYLQYYDPQEEYILTYSGQDVVERHNLLGMSKDALALARNEIYARHGYYFSSEDLLTYFAFCSWYRPDPGKTTADGVNLASQESKNVSVIREYEKNPGFDPANLDTKLTYCITTDYFSIHLPAYWERAANYYYSGDYIDFVQVASMYGAGGHLFAVGVYKTMEEIQYHPSYFTLGTISNDAGERYYVVVTEPTDVQFEADEYTTGQYQYMHSEMRRILATIKGIDGYTYKPL